MTEIDAKALEAARNRLGLMVGSLRQGNYLPSSLRGAYGRELDFPEIASKCADDIALVLATVTPKGERRVKPLVWEERRGVAGTFEAETSIGTYIATINDDNEGYWFLRGQTRGTKCDPDIHAVKADAQADYEARIRSALE